MFTLPTLLSRPSPPPHTHTYKVLWRCPPTYRHALLEFAALLALLISDQNRSRAETTTASVTITTTTTTTKTKLNQKQRRRDAVKKKEKKRGRKTLTMATTSGRRSKQCDKNNARMCRVTRAGRTNNNNNNNNEAHTHIQTIHTLAHTLWLR